MKWEPIETAPKDGARIIVYSSTEGVLSSHFEGGGWQNFPWYSDWHKRIEAQPTHWAHLPDAPKATP